MTTSSAPAWLPVRRVLLEEVAIQLRVAELAAAISRDYAGKGELLLVGVLRGAFIFLADLARRLTVPHRVDFIALASYDAGDRRSDAVRLLLDLRHDIAGEHVVVVEDIVDSGHTLAFLLETLTARRPASLRTCSLLRKPSRLEVAAPVDYLGFDIPDLWVVGYGLDYAGQSRTLPYVGVVEPPVVNPP
jgi:hypoxanthine phosphoribosyltransferase